MMPIRRSSNSLRWADRLLTATIGAAAGVFLARNFFFSERKIKEKIKPDFAVADPEFARTVNQLFGPPLLDGNSVTPLCNGCQIFPAMLRAIMDAKRSITLENFVWTEGHVTMQFAEALAARARAGVRVHILQDAIGCAELTGRSMQMLRDSPVELEIFRLYGLTQINQRTHRKLLIIDGKVGFTGGVAIADDWDGDADEPEHWRDMQYRIEGPVVGQLQQAFHENWMETRACVLLGDDYFPELKPVGNQRCQAFKSSATEGADSARVMLMLSLAAARHSIRIANAYFLPDDLVIDTIVDALDRGVDIEVIVPGEMTDQHLVRKVGRQRWAKMIRAGARFYEYQPARYHCKYLVVDECWSSVGSANIDDRSLRLNEEANLNVLDRDFALRHLQIFEEDKACSRQITLEEWENRPMSEKVAGTMGGLLRSQL
jgi:cardiolipin synthase A/B